MTDGRRFATSAYHFYDSPTRGFDADTMQDLGCLFPFIGEEGWLTIGPTGHYQGSEGIESEFLYVAEHLDGHQQTYTAEEFATAFDWKNDPQQATFLKLVETKEVEPSEAKVAANSSIGLSFDGVDDYVSVPSLEFKGGPLTLEAWITPTGLTYSARSREEETRRKVMSWNDHAELWIRDGNPSENLWGQAFWPAGPPTIHSGVLRNDVAQHLAFVISENSLILFLDGKNVAMSALQPKDIQLSANTPNGNFAIGAGIDPWHKDKINNFFHGMVHSVRISKAALYEDNFQPEPLDVMSSTIALYDFSQASGDVLKDVSGNGNDGKIHGATWIDAKGRNAEPSTSESKKP
ncbi:MAG: LamG domain-containing protein [Planctomycetaceae bacterium]